jgi:cytochrome c biogenesis protein
LLLIAVTITIGSIIEQDQVIGFYKENYPLNKPLFGFFTWEFITFFQLDHIYKAFWFFIILIIFGTCLISCTFFQQFPTLKFSRRCHFYKNLKNMDFDDNIFKDNIGNFLTKIINKGYFVFQQKNKIYASTGIIGRIAPVFVHLSIIIILFGSIIASISGFNSQELIPKGEIFHIQNVIASGPISHLSKQAIRINDFWINYYKNEKIKQFYSNISILDPNGIELINKTIFVNRPLIYKNLTFYQTDWNLVALRIENSGKFFQLPLILSKQANNKIWLTWLPLNNNIGNSIVLNNYKGAISIYDIKGNLIKKIDKNEYIFGKNYQILDLISSTGLQIKSDPGLYYIYVGFGFLMISTILSYISFSQIWSISENIKFLSIGGKTNRTKFSLKIELFKITKSLK